MFKHRIFFARCIALLVIVGILFSGCAPKQPANTPDNSTPVTDSSTLARCEEALQEYLNTGGNAEGAVVYSSGNYFAVIGGKLYAGQNIQPHSYAGAGETVVSAVATFRGIPYIEDSQGAKACNYQLETIADGKTYSVSFYLNGTVQTPSFITLYNKGDVQITKGIIGQIVYDTPNDNPIKNVIYMIADGGGYDNFTLADKVKEEMTKRGVNKLSGAKTEVTNDLLTNLGKPVTNGLYLNEFLVGSANTLLTVPHGDADSYKSYITDSSASGTALSSGYKTTYCYAGITSDGTPRASITELARMNGMSTGVVTTKSYIDATPLAFFTSHSIHRYENIDNSLQALLSGVDVVIAEGTEYGDLCTIDESTHPDVSASKLGYTVAKNKTQLLEQATTAKKLWAPIWGVEDTLKEIKEFAWDYASHHISYDVDADDSTEQPSLLDMTKAALQVLGSNINNPEGFFLMIEGGALDNAAESGYLRPAIGEYLAFDEAFGYCVNWAAERGDTIVIAVPDHDSGGFSGIENCQDALIDGIITGKIGETNMHSLLSFSGIKTALNKIGADTSAMKLHSGHTDMAVPICLYAPDSIRQELLKNMTLPTAPGNVRTGNNEYYVKNESGTFTWYASSALNNDYVIDNTKIAPAIAKTLNLGSLDDASSILFNNIDSNDGTITVYNSPLENSYGEYYPVTYTSKDKTLTVDRNSIGYKLNGQLQDNTKIGNLMPKSLFVLSDRKTPDQGRFYVPYSVLSAAKLGWCVTISCDDFPFDKVLFADGTSGITLPSATEGKQIIYTDGIHAYNPGDTIPYSGTDLKLQAYIK